jgi:Ribbon-helix-helix domain
MPLENTTRACLTLRSSQLRALRGLSRETGAPVAELTRRAVDAFLTARVPGYPSGPERAAPPSDQPDPTITTTCC